MQLVCAVSCYPRGHLFDVPYELLVLAHPSAHRELLLEHVRVLSVPEREGDVFQSPADLGRYAIIVMIVAICLPVARDRSKRSGL